MDTVDEVDQEKHRWRDIINDDLKNRKLTRVDPANRIESRKKLRTNMGAARPIQSGTSMLNE